MAYQVWGDRWLTGEMSDATIAQQVVPNFNMRLKTVRACLIAYNDPAFTALSMKIYTKDVEANAASSNVYATSSDTQAKASLMTDDNAIIETYFSFSEIDLRRGDTYYFAVQATGYTGTASSHLAWRKGWPDHPQPIIRSGSSALSASREKLGVWPYWMFLAVDEVD